MTLPVQWQERFVGLGMRTGKILILTVPHGASHERLANALRKALIEIQPSLTVEVVNALDHCAPWFRAYYNSYEIPLKYWPALWGWIENIQHKRASTGPVWLYGRGARPLFRFIQAFGPEIVIATEVGVCELAAIMKRETNARFHLVGAPTEVDLDRAWAQREVDLYPVAPGEAVGQLETEGVSPSRILACGTPIDGAFVSTHDKGQVRASLGINPDVPLLLVLFGGAGIGNPRQILAELAKVGAAFQRVFITGRNPRLQEELEQICSGAPQTRVLGWVENIHEWMAAADLALGKPGASTVTEAINTGLPFIAFDPLPGGERRTCEWIEEHQVGFWIRRPAELAPTLTRLLTDGKELQGLRERILPLARPQAAHTAAAWILKLLEARQ